jgi:hypothetical protein
MDALAPLQALSIQLIHPPIDIGRQIGKMRSGLILLKHQRLPFLLKV